MLGRQNKRPWADCTQHTRQRYRHSAGDMCLATARPRSSQRQNAYWQQLHSQLDFFTKSHLMNMQTMLETGALSLPCLHFIPPLHTPPVLTANQQLVRSPTALPTFLESTLIPGSAVTIRPNQHLNQPGLANMVLQAGAH